MINSDKIRSKNIPKNLPKYGSMFYKTESTAALWTDDGTLRNSLLAIMVPCIGVFNMKIIQNA